MTSKLSSVTRSPAATEALGRCLAPLLETGDVVLLIGGLGAGKTTFVRGLAGGLGYGGDVTSPTFTICHGYDGRVRLVHADLWRLERAGELADLALEEELEEGSALVVEWGEAALDAFGEEALIVHLGPGSIESERAVDLEVRGTSWQDRAGRLREMLEQERLERDRRPA